jgi:hypothetical protein
MDSRILDVFISKAGIQGKEAEFGTELESQ